LLFDPGITQSAFFNSNIGDQRIRQGQFPIRNEKGVIIGHVTVGISQEESAVVLHNLRTTLWIAFPILLLILFMASALAASKGIDPVQQLIKAAAEIGGKNIQKRLPLPENQDEIHQLATTINALLERVERSIRREKQLTADASHEIRTPLTAMRGTLEVLLRKPRTTAHYEEKISQVIRETDRLNDLLDQLLQLARLESGAVSTQLHAVDLPDLFRSLESRWQAALEEKRISFHWDALPGSQVFSDAKLLGILLDNLVGNAIKYGHTEGRLDCRWQSDSRILSIRDDGPGIPSEHLPFLFDRFYRGDDSRDAKVPGAGLGLSIAKKLADLLGINLVLTSESGKGTLCQLEFP
jgi:signal transduction histidine kinase